MLFPGGLTHVLLQPRILPRASVIWHGEACMRLLSNASLAGYVSHLTKKYGG
jgi:hypothetical protein